MTARKHCILLYGAFPIFFGPDSFVEPGVNEHIWSSHLLYGKFSDLCECLRSIPLKAYSMDDALVNVDGVFSGLVTSSLVTEWPYSLLFFVREPFCWAQVGKGECQVFQIQVILI